MKQFDVNADRLIIRFDSLVNHEEIEHEFIDMPIPDYCAETIRNSENSEEEVFDPEVDGHTYKIVVYKNTVEGNVEVFDETENTEIDDFEIEELFDNEIDEDVDEDYEDY